MSLLSYVCASLLHLFFFFRFFALFLSLALISDCSDSDSATMGVTVELVLVEELVLAVGEEVVDDLDSVTGGSSTSVSTGATSQILMRESSPAEARRPEEGFHATLKNTHRETDEGRERESEREEEEDGGRKRRERETEETV